jgi:hypothetical protein
MNHTIVALCLAVAGGTAAAQSGPGDRAADPPSKAPARCEPYPACVLTTSPLQPGAPGIGIRDKALIERLQGPVPRTQRDSIVKKPEQ